MHPLQRFITRPSWLVGVCVLGLLLGAFGGPVSAQGPEPSSPDLALGTGFSYQGHLQKNGTPVNGACGLTFSLWDSQSNGLQLGSSQVITPVNVINGGFTVVLNGASQFSSSAFSGQDRWLQTAVQCSGDNGPLTLSRQQLTAEPYAFYAPKAGSVSWSGVSGVSAPLNFLASPSPCLSSMVAQWNGTNWTCAVLAGGNTYNAGFGLSLTSNTFNVNTATVQARLNAACLSGAAIGAIQANGTPSCQSFWALSGNANANPASYFLGTTDAQPLVVKTNNAERLRIDTSGNVGIGTSAPGRSLHVSSANSGLRLQSSSSSVWTTTEYQTDARLWHTGVGGSAVTNDVKSKFYIADLTSAQFRLTIDTNGNVGVGTTAPSAQLSVVKSGAPEPSVQGVPTGVKIGVPAGTIPLALRQNTASSTTPGLAYFETNDGWVGGIGADGGGLVINAATGKGLSLNSNGATQGISITNEGKVAIGGAVPGVGVWAKLNVRGTDNSTSPFAVSTNNGDLAFQIWADGSTAINHLNGSTTSHLCSNAALVAACSSAAEYVPSIDGGSGFPETADLVSIAPAVSNPYGDTHGPFTVQKSATACDPNLLGYIVKPESGADGPKLNEHYLPLSIYGYFPAKVTLENGPIHRGDPLTSSSRPGYGMKATGACKIIGYALDDAQQDGTIQVFSHLSENAAPEVASLRAQVDELKKQNDALAARLDALEKR